MTITRIKPRPDGRCPLPVCSGQPAPGNWDRHLRWHQILADLRNPDWAGSTVGAAYCRVCHVIAVRPFDHEHAVSSDG